MPLKSAIALDKARESGADIPEKKTDNSAVFAHDFGADFGVLTDKDDPLDNDFEADFNAINRTFDSGTIDTPDISSPKPSTTEEEFVQSAYSALEFAARTGTDKKMPKMEKARADYRPATGRHRCGNCSHGNPVGEKVNACDIVDGPIEAKDTCDFWMPMMPKGPADLPLQPMAYHYSTYSGHVANGDPSEFIKNPTQLTVEGEEPLTHLSKDYAAKWDEAKHPRKGGKFTKKGQASKGETKSEKEAKRPGKVDSPKGIPAAKTLKNIQSHNAALKPQHKLSPSLMRQIDSAIKSGDESSMVKALKGVISHNNALKPEHKLSPALIRDVQAKIDKPEPIARVPPEAQPKGSGRTREDVNKKISQLILANVRKGMKADEAIDDLLGPGTFKKLASDLYDKLRARGKPEN